MIWYICLWTAVHWRPVPSVFSRCCTRLNGRTSISRSYQPLWLKLLVDQDRISLAFLTPPTLSCSLHLPSSLLRYHCFVDGFLRLLGLLFLVFKTVCFLGLFGLLFLALWGQLWQSFMFRMVTVFSGHLAFCFYTMSGKKTNTFTRHSFLFLTKTVQKKTFY